MRADPDALKPTKAAAPAGGARGFGAAVAAKAAPPPPQDEGEFVPEEEEEGPATQGDGLMAAKAKRQSSGLLSPGKPDVATPAEPKK